VQTSGGVHVRGKRGKCFWVPRLCRREDHELRVGGNKTVRFESSQDLRFVGGSQPVGRKSRGEGRGRGRGGSGLGVGLANPSASLWGNGCGERGGGLVN